MDTPQFLLEEAMSGATLRGFFLGVMAIAAFYVFMLRPLQQPKTKPWWVDMNLPFDQAKKIMDDFWKTRATEKAAS